VRRADEYQQPAQFVCTICGKTNSQKNNMLNHVESVHFPSLFLYECQYCGKAHNTKNALSVHISVKHKFRKF
jgi:DNA-directed RNA polymerase subunit RPC12/RpoP